MNAALIASMQARLDAVYASDTVKPACAPFATLGLEMVEKLPSINGKILVLSDLGLLTAIIVRLRREKKSIEEVTFIAHTIEQTEFANQQLDVKVRQIGYNKPIEELKKQLMGMKFDVVIGNPPYQEVDETGVKKNHAISLWAKFVTISVNLLNEKGRLAFITPTSWMSGGKYAPKAFRLLNLEILNPNCSSYFPGVGSQFCWYIIQKAQPGITTVVANNALDFKININALAFMPIPLIKETASILRKVFNGTSFGIIPSKEGIAAGGFGHNVDRISKMKTIKHIYPLFHTNAQVLYTDIPAPHASKKKVMWTLSGYFRPFYDDGIFGSTQISQYMLVKDAEHGKRVLSFLNSKLIQAIVGHICKYSGFISPNVLQALPYVPDRMWSDEDLYKYFNLTEIEIKFIENITFTTPKSLLQGTLKDMTLTNLKPTICQVLDKVISSRINFVKAIETSAIDIRAEPAAVGQIVRIPITGDVVYKEMSIRKSRAVAIQWHNGEIEMANQFDQAFNNLIDEVEADMAITVNGYSSFQGLFRIPTDPAHGDTDDDTLVIVDPITNLPFQIKLYRQYHQNRIEVGLAWG